MESNQKSNLIDQVIRNLLAEKRSDGGDFPENLQNENNQILVSKLISEFESSKPEALDEKKEVNSPAVGEVNKEESSQISTEEIMKEIKQMKKQNVVTHWLLSALIVLTLGWQVSEVSLILRLKNGISHPFKFFGGMLAGMFRVPGISEKDKEEINSSESDSAALQMPELPHMLELPLMPELPHIDMGSNDKKSR